MTGILDDEQDVMIARKLQTRRDILWACYIDGVISVTADLMENLPSWNGIARIFVHITPYGVAGGVMVDVPGVHGFDQMAFSRAIRLIPDGLRRPLGVDGDDAAGRVGHLTLFDKRVERMGVATIVKCSETLRRKE
ncbi:hypothetical protein B0O99DRAFT_693617 [Bisporella sp. PMI_857]|nr:hypothetical protein B0O99DRAFT_693617 [Bisporella sp. PMI_857]